MNGIENVVNVLYLIGVMLLYFFSFFFAFTAQTIKIIRAIKNRNGQPFLKNTNGSSNRNALTNLNPESSHKPGVKNNSFGCSHLRGLYVFVVANINTRIIEILNIEKVNSLL